MTAKIRGGNSRSDQPARADAAEHRRLTRLARTSWRSTPFRASIGPSSGRRRDPTIAVRSWSCESVAVVVRYPAYRRYSEARIAVNDALMALLIGARLGEHALANSAANANAMLPELFGRIDGIARLNRTVGDAAVLLARAEEHLVYMAIPYALSVHGSFVSASAEMLRTAGHDQPDGQYTLDRQSDLAQLPLDVAHEYVEERCRLDLDPTLLQLFHLSRRLRNRIIHFSGVAGSRLPREYRPAPQACSRKLGASGQAALDTSRDRRPARLAGRRADRSSSDESPSRSGGQQSPCSHHRSRRLDRYCRRGLPGISCSKLR